MKTKPDNFWTDKNVCITGGAAMIGSELVRQLSAKNPRQLWVVDDMSSGQASNLPSQVSKIVVDLSYRDDAAESAINGADIVFHLACAHGGRGFVDTHRLACFQNLGLDANVFRICADVGVKKVVFASSACVYPTELQVDLEREFKLSEDLVDYQNTKQADGAYGMAKLLAEQTLDAYARDGKFDAVMCRMFTVYGRNVKMNHAIGALIAKSYTRQDPFQIWGNGLQVRNWTYVKDTARGLILAAEKMRSGAVNLGSEQQYTVHQAATIIWEQLGWKPKRIEYQIDAPVGTLNRVADGTKARELLGWEPEYTLENGLDETIEWFTGTYAEEQVRAALENDALTKR